MRKCDLAKKIHYSLGCLTIVGALCTASQVFATLSSDQEIRSSDREETRSGQQDQRDDRDNARDEERSLAWNDERSDQNDRSRNEGRITSDAQTVDEHIAKDIQYALSPGFFKKGYEQVRGSVRSGNVILTGTVDSQKDKEDVEKAVRNVRGVRDIDNNVKVLEGAQREQGSKISAAFSDITDSSDDENNSQLTPDEKIQKQVRYDLKPGTFSKGYDEVTSTVKNGTVTLSGRVDTQSDKETLEKKVREISGVHGVENNVKVLGPAQSKGQVEQISDDQLLKNVRYELEPGMLTSGYDQVKVTVKNGNVTLTGSVQTPKDKEDVDETVRGIKGVRSLDNQVKVSELGG